MARLLAALLATATALLAVGQLCDATQSEAEEFWGTVLPNSPLPDAILRLLHPDNSVSQAKHVDAKGRAELSRLSRSFKPSSVDDDSGRSSGIIRFIYQSHKPSSPKTFISDDNTVSAVKAKIFFHEEALQVGKNLTLYFQPAVTAPLGLLPRHVADSIPLSVASLLGVLGQLGFTADPVQAANMQWTLEMCASSPSPGEEHLFCATSLEALVEGAIAMLGSSDIKPVTSILPSSGAPLQAYTIRGVRPVEGSSFVACHDQDYPYTVYICHATGSARAYMVDIEGAAGSDVVTAVTVCHTDTSGWDPKHMAFKFLGTKPGGAPVCHMLPYGNIIWAKNEIRSSA